MGILPFKCGIDGCKKSKLQKHTHQFGEMRNFGDRQLIEQYRIFAEMRGESVQIPGGSSQDMQQYMRTRVKEGSKQAAEFRKQVSREFDELKKQKGNKATMQEAEQKARKKFKWKK